MTMKYVLFAFDIYYPQGGMNDVRGYYSTTEEAVEAWLKMGYDNYQVMDRATLEKVGEGNLGMYNP